MSFPSCEPPTDASSFLTIGASEANGARSNSVGFVTFKVNPAAERFREVTLTSTISDVRCEPSTDAAVCNAPNDVAGPDYSGELQIDAIVRISDHHNGPGLHEPATVIDLPNPVKAICSNTTDTTIGGLCTITTSLTALVPTPEGFPRAVVGVDKIVVRDGGADGDIETADNMLFMTQGIFVP